jgi:hypothetical protein
LIGSGYASDEEKQINNKLNHMIVTEVIDQDTVGEYAGMVVLFPKSVLAKLAWTRLEKSASCERMTCIR